MQLEGALTSVRSAARHRPWRTPTGLAGLALAIALATAGCSSSSSSSQQSPQNQPPDGGGQALDDNAILFAQQTANTGEVQEGQLAQGKASAAIAKAFADEMVADHLAANARLDTVAQQAGLTPAESPVSEQLRAEAEQSLAELQTKEGAEFDLAYAQSEVEAHQQALDLLDATLIPQASNPALKAELQRQRFEVQSHLIQAQILLGALQTQPGDGTLLFAQKANNTGEIDKANAALAKPLDREVRNYSQEIVADHTEANGRIDTLSSTLAFPLAPSPLSEAIDDANAEALARLQPLEQVEFERLYMNIQVAEHETILWLLDTKLIPEASNADVKQELVNERGTVEDHLTKAKAIVESLTPGGDTSVLTDGQIVFAQKTANTGEVEQGQLAATKATDPAVKAFAEKMVADHTTANERLETIKTSGAIPDFTSPQSQQLQSQATETLAQLQAAESGPAFDQAYIQSQIQAHTQVLALLDSTLIPQARDADLKGELQNQRATVAEHLADAQALAAALPSP